MAENDTELIPCPGGCNCFVPKVIVEAVIARREEHLRADLAAPDAAQMEPRPCWASATGEQCVNAEACDDRGCQLYSAEWMVSEIARMKAQNARLQIAAGMVIDHCNGCGNIIEGWPNVYRCAECDRLYHKECLLTHCASDRQPITDAVRQARRKTWEAAIEAVRLSAKKSEAAGQNIATVEIAIRRLEAAPEGEKGEGNETRNTN